MLTEIAPSEISMTSLLQAAMITKDPEERLDWLLEVKDLLDTVITVCTEEVGEDLDDHYDTL